MRHRRRRHRVVRPRRRGYGLRASLRAGPRAGRRPEGPLASLHGDVLARDGGARSAHAHGVLRRDHAVPPDAALRRIAKLGDGWSPNFAPDAQGRVLVDRVYGYAREAGRDRAQLPLEGRIRFTGEGPEGWMKQVEAWKSLGATY